VRDYAPEVPLIVVLRSSIRRGFTDQVPTCHFGGTGRRQILAHHLLDEQVVNVESRIKFSRLYGTLVGAHPWRSQALDRTGAKVVAVERGHDVLVEFDDDFLVRRDDALFVCGSINSLERYQREFQVTTAPAVRV
jgi:uncharacterized protein with PhoU and TrkA domain